MDIKANEIIFWNESLKNNITVIKDVISNVERMLY